MAVDTLREEGAALLAEDNLAGCIERFEAELRALPETPLHRVLGRNLLSRLDAATRYLEQLAALAAPHIRLAQVNLTVEGISSNPSVGLVDAEEQEHHPEIDDLDWFDAMDDVDLFDVEGFAELPDAAEALDDGSEQAGLVIEIAELLTALRLMELIRAAKANAPALAGVPVLTSAADIEFYHVAR